MAEKNCPRRKCPENWQFYRGDDGVTHYISLVEVVGVKHDETGADKNPVTLRLSNGHFVNINESIDKVLNDIASCC